MSSTGPFGVFLQDTSLHGVRYLVGHESRLRVTIWLFLLLAVTTFCIINLVETIQRYQRHESFISSTSELKDTLRLPAITICPIESYKESTAKNKFPDIYNFLTDGENRGNITSSEKLTETPITVFNQETGFSLEELFIQCSKGTIWNALNCSEFIELTLTDLSLCYTFNGAKTRHPIMASGPSRQHGFSLILDANIDEGILPMVSGRGFFAVIHEHTEYPNVRSDTFLLKPGTTTQIKLQKIADTKLGKPYSEESCYKDMTQILEDKDFNHLKSYDYPYSQTLCHFDCIIHQIFFPACDFLPRSNRKLCTYADLSTDANSKHVKYMSGRISLKEECQHCHPLCTRCVYKTAMSTAGYPDKSAQTVIKKNRPWYNDSEVERNILELNIFYETMLELHTEQLASFPGSTLFSNVGGLLGLCLGASLITALEFFDYICVTLMRKVSRKVTQVQKNPNKDEN